MVETVQKETIRLVSQSPEETYRLGVWLGEHVQPGDVVLVSGPLGAGKTLFVQGIAEGLGVQEHVRSPTFTLVSEYHSGRIPLYHVDLYRLDGHADLSTVGLEEYLERADGVVVVEWPERAPGWFPQDVLRVHLEHGGGQKRHIQVEGKGNRFVALVRAFKQEIMGAADAAGH